MGNATSSSQGSTQRRQGIQSKPDQNFSENEATPNSLFFMESPPAEQEKFSAGMAFNQNPIKTFQAHVKTQFALSR